MSSGVAFVPGGAFHPGADGANTIRLSYSLPTPEAIREGTRRLAVAPMMDWVDSQEK